VLIDRKQRPWASGSGTAAACFAVLYAIYAFTSPNGPKGGTVPGIIFGSLAFAAMIFECLLGLRKKYPASPIGRLQTWLRAHIWLGLLTIVLVFCHSGFHWGRGLASWLMWLFVIVTASGIAGVLLQNYVPSRMTQLVTRETVYRQIPFVIDQLRREADTRVEFVTADLGIDDPEPEVLYAGGRKFYFDPAQRKSAGEKVAAEVQKRKTVAQVPVDKQSVNALRRHYLNEVRPYLSQSPSTFTARLFGDPASLKAYFERLRILLAPDAHPVVRDLESICDERRQLAVQARLHVLLHAWLYLHVPLSFAVLLLSAVHAVVALSY
jgi:hypothetical protein